MLTINTLQDWQNTAEFVVDSEGDKELRYSPLGYWIIKHHGVEVGRATAPHSALEVYNSIT